MGTRRVRLVFDKELSKSPNIRGLKRCWISLKPQHKTISDLSSHLLHLFDLLNACPAGLLLSMEGFVLPPFESTSVLKDNDIIRVKKLGDDTSLEMVKVDGGLDELQVVEIVDRPPEPAPMNLLANEEFEKELGGYEPGDDPPERVEDTLHVEDSPEVAPVSKKRKASTDPQGSISMRKKNRSENAKERKVVSEDIGNNGHAVQGETVGTAQVDKGSRNKTTTLTGAKKSPHHLKQKSKCGKQHTPECCTGAFGLLPAYKDFLNKSSDVIRLDSSDPRGNETNGNECGGSTPSEINKFPSRSTRRKKAMRQRRREILKAQMKEKQLLGKISQQSANEKGKASEGSKMENQNTCEEIPEENMNKLNEDHKTSEELLEEDSNKLNKDRKLQDPNGDVDDDIIPVVVRPGHIRFTPANEVGTDQNIQQNQIPVETFQWNGIKSKKKGQKWGKEKASSYKKNDYRNAGQEWPRTSDADHRSSDKEFPRTTDADHKTSDKEFPRTTDADHKTSDKELSRKSAAEKEKPINDHINFDKLAPYTTLPKEDDVIAYRLIELSSSWTPELSSYRVGRISRYDIESNMVLLLPVPEYPIFPEKVDGEASIMEADTSTYSEDGSLQIKFSLLIDVRLVKHGNQNSTKSVTVGDNESYVRNKDAGKGLLPNGNNEAHASYKETNGWKEIDEVLNAKKAELTQQDNGNKAESSGKKPWSYRALRGSALGPTMAFLRSQNEL